MLVYMITLCFTFWRSSGSFENFLVDCNETIRLTGRMRTSDADRMVNHRAQADSFRETLAALGRQFIIPGDLVEHWCWFISGFRALPKMLVIAVDIQGCMS